MIETAGLENIRVEVRAGDRLWLYLEADSNVLRWDIESIDDRIQVKKLVNALTQELDRHPPRMAR